MFPEDATSLKLDEGPPLEECEGRCSIAACGYLCGSRVISVFKRGPPGPMSGLVELYETYDGILHRLRGEGYVHGGDETPYARDSTLQDLTTRTATRLHLYPDVDFGAYTNQQRKE
jgi:hypothetical protein